MPQENAASVSRGKGPPRSDCAFAIPSRRDEAGVGRWSQGEFAAVEVLERIWDERIRHKVCESRKNERDNKSKNGNGSWGGESGLFFSCREGKWRRAQKGASAVT